MPTKRSGNFPYTIIQIIKHVVELSNYYIQYLHLTFPRFNNDLIEFTTPHFPFLRFNFSEQNLLYIILSIVQGDFLVDNIISTV